jgi:hypothetical protein
MAIRSLFAIFSRSLNQPTAAVPRLPRLWQLLIGFSLTLGAIGLADTAPNIQSVFPSYDATSSTLAQQAASTASAETDLDELAAQWWQWALSIPTEVNPLEDTTGANCMVGQSDPVWFLAGFFNGSAATRSCSVPEGAALFLPVINAINFNTPNVCGQGSASISVKDLRAFSASFIAGASNLSVSVDSQPVTTLKHIKSIVFDVALPGDNVFNALCGGPGTVPANIYSPAVDDGIYVLLKPLKVGQHSLHFHAENVSQSFVEDITYVLTVVPRESE